MSLREEIEKLIREQPIRGDELLVALNLKKYFPVRRGLSDILKRRRLYVRAVDGISFGIKDGEVFCLVGESGCGKTTTGRTVIGLTPPTAGYLLYRPRPEIAKQFRDLGFEPVYKDYFLLNDLFRNKKANKLLRRELQIIFQDPYGSLNPRFTIYSTLEEPLVVHGIAKTYEERFRYISKALEDVKLTPPEEFMKRYPHQLSGGQRQRVVIARALILDPRFIVADEPVSMLDVSIRAEILQLMLELKARRNLTYLFITHDLAIARLICNRIAVMYLGKIVEMGPADEIIEKPIHPYTKALVAAIPEPDPSNRFKIRDLPIKGEVPSAINIPPGCRFHPRCPHAFDKCSKEEPSLIEVEPGHYAACWLYHK